jgi:hypothetical protein
MAARDLGELVEQDHQEGVLGWEMAIDGRTGDAGGGGDVVHPRAVEAPALKQLLGRRQDHAPPLAPSAPGLYLGHSVAPSLAIRGAPAS